MKIRNNEQGIADTRLFNALRKKTGDSGILSRYIDSEKAEQLEGLTLSSGTPVDNLEFLRFFPNLHRLVVRLAPGGSIKGIRHVKDIKSLTISDTSFELDITPLTQCRQLEELTMGEHGIAASFTGDESLRELTSLKTLMIHGPNGKHINSKASAVDVSWIKDMTQLESLGLMGNLVEDITPIFRMKNLKILDISYCRVKSLAGVEAMEQLVMLLAEGNGISDISPVVGLKNLQILDVSECALTSIAGLETMESLEEVELNGNSITDLERLSSLPSLKTIIADDNKLDPDEISRLNSILDDGEREVIL